MTPRSLSLPPSLGLKIAALNNDPNKCKCAAVTTGGGAALGSWLIGTPGASSVVLDFQVPYVQSALTAYLDGCEPKRFCSADTATLLSQRALVRAKELWLLNNNGSLRSLADNKFVGLGGTAAIVSSSPKRGSHRAFVACTTDEGTHHLSVTMKKGARDRVGEDEMVSRLLLRALVSTKSCGLGNWDDALVDGEVVSEDFTPRPDPLESLLSGDPSGASCVLIMPAQEGKGDSIVYPDFKPQTKTIVYPGSFNPLHKGHTELAKAAQKVVDGSPPLVFEISAANPDKPSLSKAVVEARVGQFDFDHPVVITRAPLFLEKARLMPNCAFIVGADTAMRILNPKYYGNSEAEMIMALTEMKQLGTSFLVGGRKVGEEFLILDDILSPLGHLPPTLLSMFVALPDFRVDLSSSEIRAAKSILS
jgi:hypothetical protein